MVDKSIMDLPSFLAEQFKESTKGLGTCDSKLIRLTVSRSEIDLQNIKESYLRIHGKILEEDVKVKLFF